MRPLRTRLQEARKRLGLPWEALERDYLLSWILAGIAEVAGQRETLVFKGGTALRKCYFGDYRFSEDLDFTATSGNLTGDAMEQVVAEACAVASQLIDPYAPVEIEYSRYVEREPHPGGQEAFSIYARMPWHRQLRTRVMIEITVDEPILRPTPRKKLLHDYGEPIEAEILTYSLEEIVAEKLRAILQHLRQLERRGWSRSRARDFYDLWRILGTYGSRMDFRDFEGLLEHKCSVRDVGFTGPEDFFDRRVLANVEASWSQWLGPLVPGLPPFHIVITELRPMIASLLPPSRRS